MKFTQFHIDILLECDGENGVVKSPYFIEGSFVIYSIKNGSLSLWIFHNLPNRNNNFMAIPTFYIVASPKDKIQGAGHQIDCMIIRMVDGLVEANLRDYIDMVLDYLCLRQWADIEVAEVQTRQKKEMKGKKNNVIQNGISYFVFDSKWFTEVCNNNEFIVSGHFRLQPYGDGTKKLIAALPVILLALREGRMVIIDELDAKLHPKLLKYVISLFKNKELNKYGAQLLFTSHDMYTLRNTVFRRDEIWFAAENHAHESEIYSLHEIRGEDNDRIKNTAAYDKQYLEGRYGADPYLSNMLGGGF